MSYFDIITRFDVLEEAQTIRYDLLNSYGYNKPKAKKSERKKKK